MGQGDGQVASERGASGGRWRFNQPSRLAFWLALGYFSFASVYIVISSDWAAGLARTQAELHWFEQIKGISFIVVTTILLFLFAYLLFRRVAGDERALADYRETLLTANRRAVAGLFASSVAHDINNILVVIESVTEQLGEADSEEKERLLRHLLSANEELKGLVKRLASAPSDKVSEEERVFNLSAEVRRITDLVRSHRKARWCAFHLDAPERLEVVGRPALYHQMLLNLLINAAEATDGRGEVRVLLREREGKVVLEVHDDGPGIPADRRTAVMEPFITSKADGCGLGLLSVRVCVEAQGGSVTVGDSELGGACFRVTAPRERRPAAASAPEPADAGREDDGGRV